jgi:hypothetical protein
MSTVISDELWFIQEAVLTYFMKMVLTYSLENTQESHEKGLHE